MNNKNLSEIGATLETRLKELDELVGTATMAVRKRISNFVEMGEPAIGKKEAASILGYKSTRTLDAKLKLKNPPPHYIDGSRVTFYASELRAWKRIYLVGRLPGGNESNHSSAT